MCRGAYIPYFKNQRALFLLPPLFRKISISHVYPTCISHYSCRNVMVLMVLWLVANTFVSQKNWICSFSLMPPNKTLPQVLIITQRQNQIPHSFWKKLSKNISFPSRKREDYGGEKKWPKLNLGGYWSQVLISSNIFLQPLHVWFLFSCAMIYTQTCWSVRFP